MTRFYHDEMPAKSRLILNQLKREVSFSLVCFARIITGRVKYPDCYRNENLHG
jgi:hypothetical protein